MVYESAPSENVEWSNATISWPRICHAEPVRSSTEHTSQEIEHSNQQSRKLGDIFDRFSKGRLSLRATSAIGFLSLATCAAAKGEIAFSAQTPLETTKYLVGILGSVSYYGITYGLFDQIRKNHSAGEVKQGLSLGKLAGNGFRYTVWTLWACAQSPINGFFLATRLPGSVLSCILLSQKLKARKSPSEYVAVGATALAAVSGLGLATHNLASPTVATGLEVVAAASLLGVAVFGGRDQIRRLRTHGTAGVSLTLQTSFALNYSLWSCYSALEGKLIASVGFGLAAIVGWLCMAQFSKRFNPLAADRSATMKENAR